MSLDPEVVARLEKLGTDSAGRPNLSAGIAIVEHVTRGMDLERYKPPIARVKVDEHRSWIVFELVDGEPDPLPPGGIQVDAWRTS